MNNLCVIPARGGSKRIPRKNIKDFLGKPIISYSIEVAFSSGLFQEVMVSTDDEEIANISEKFGAKIPFLRSTKSADDFATTMDVLKEVVYDYNEKFNKVFDYICCIYPTAPLVQTIDLIKGLNLLIEKDFDTVFPVVAFGYPVWRGFRFGNEGKTQMVWEEYKNARSQDLEKVFHDAGQWYWYNPLKVGDSLFTDNSTAIVLDEDRVQDIDTEIDWKLAEIKYELLQSTKKTSLYFR
jgi:N-acylneuraminate cytidylyltransferase